MLSRLSQQRTFRLVYTGLTSVRSSRIIPRQIPNLLDRSVWYRQQKILNTRRYYSSAPMAAPTDTQATEMQNATGVTPEGMAQTLREKLDASHVDIQDISGGCGQSFAALIVSPQFQGKAALARHRLVNGVLKEEIAAIHAWTPRCLTPEQWEKEKEKLAAQ